MKQHNNLLRVLGLVSGLAAVVGRVIGQGILRAPGVVAQADSSVAVLLGSFYRALIWRWRRLARRCSRVSTSR